MMPDIEYRTDTPISAEQFITLLSNTSLGARRPIDETKRIKGMLEHANLLVCAWLGDTLVGVARSVTDFHYCCYLSDLAVHESWQSKGIGHQLITETLNAIEPGCKLILLSAPQATDYYPKKGFVKHDSAWVLADKGSLV